MSELNKSASQWKDEGNSFYQKKQYSEAIDSYTSGLQVSVDSDDYQLPLLKNRAQCHLLLGQHGEALKDTSAALKIAPSDSKALYRHSLALEGLQQLPEAFKSISTLIKLDRGNKEALSVARRLTENIKKQASAMQSTDHAVTEMLSVLENTDSNTDKKIRAAKNLAILSRDKPGAEKIFHSDGVSRIIKLLNSKITEMVQHLLQTLVGLCYSEARASDLIGQLTIDRLKSIISSGEKAISCSAVAVLKQALISVSVSLSEPLVNDLVLTVVALLQQQDLTADGRDRVLELVVSTVAQNGLGALFLAGGVVPALLWLAASTANDQTGLQLSDDLRMSVSVALSKLHESLGKDKPLKDLMKDSCVAYVRSHLSGASAQDKVEGLTALATLLQGALEVGNQVFGEETVLAEMVKMAEMDNVHCQAIAAEALALAASDKERCHGIMKEGMPVLKALYSSADDGVRVRALVGLCKLGSVGGSNVNARTLVAGSTVKLEKACRKFLLSPKKSDSLKKWATEGLAFLSLDAEVKESLVGDEDALKALFQVPKTQDQSLLYGLATIFVNLTNSYDKPEKNKELEELGNFAGENMPKDHEFDGEEYVKKRVNCLLSLGVVPALVSLSVTSKAIQEQVSRVLLALTREPSNRGTVIQQGGAKCLVPMATNNTDKGKFIAAQALAKIGITNDPKLAFPGQRSLEVVRPLVGLLKSEQGLQQFEGLMALTNLAGVSDDIRKRIYKEGGFNQIESLMFEDHEQLRRAATEAMCNLVSLQEVHERFLSDDVERVKLVTLFSGENDEGLAKAASGTLAQLSHDPKICTKIMAVKAAKDILKEMLVKEDPELQFRGMYITCNLIEASKEIAEDLLSGEILDLIMALCQSEKTAENVKSAASSALLKAQEYRIIKPNPQLTN